MFFHFVRGKNYIKGQTDSNWGMSPGGILLTAFHNRDKMRPQNLFLKA